MKQFIIIVVLIALGAFGVSMLIGDSNGSRSTTMQMNLNTSSEVKADQNEVFIEDFAFTPNKLTVKKGTTVTWTNKDTARHDVNPDVESQDFKASNLLGKDETYSVAFNTVGTYNYSCSPHPYMKGTVEVIE
jgi:amicyanin